MGYGPWGHKESDMTEGLELSFSTPKRLRIRRPSVPGVTDDRRVPEKLGVDHLGALFHIILKIRGLLWWSSG